MNREIGYIPKLLLERLLPDGLDRLAVIVLLSESHDISLCILTFADHTCGVARAKEHALWSS